MRAAVLKAPNLLCIENVPLPACPDGGILLRVEACGLCASDLKMWRLGHKELKLPRILGHEVAGVVEESDCAAIPVGTAVQVAPGMPCGACPACRCGAHNRCSQIGVLGFSLDGGLAEYMAVPPQGVAQGAVITLPAGLDPATATLAEPLACVLNAWQLARLAAGESVSIIGAGPLGRLAAWSAKAMGARAVVLIEKEAGRLRGLDDSGITPLAASALETVQEALDGGAEVVLPACPDPLALSQGLDLLNQGGRLVLFSGLKVPASLDLNQVHYRELTLVGAYGCTADQNRRALELLASGAIPVETIISHHLPLAGVPQGLALMERGAALKVVIHPQEE